MQNTARRPKITVSDDGNGIVSQTRALLLTQTARITGLGATSTSGRPCWRRQESARHG
jgi:hypothetical protein